MSLIPGTTKASLRRRLSQNFLHQPAALDRFMREAEVTARDHVVEVGAGTGNITVRLAQLGAEVTAYELDPAMAAWLTRAVGHFGNVRVIVGDITKATPPEPRFKAVGNLPFGVTAEIVSWTLSATALKNATYITQREYARKRTGASGRWSRLTISTWPTHRWEMRGTILKSAFRPEPRVDAGILRIEHRDPPLLNAHDLARFQSMVKLGFLGRGGSLSNSLAEAYPRKRVAHALRAAAVARDTVVAFVSPEQWLAIFRSLSQA